MTSTGSLIAGPSEIPTLADEGMPGGGAPFRLTAAYDLVCITEADARLLHPKDAGRFGRP